MLGTAAFVIVIIALLVIGVFLLVSGLRHRHREALRPLVSPDTMPLRGPHSGPLADYTAMLHEVGVIDDWQFEALLAELAIAVDSHGTFGAYAEQQREAIRERLAAERQGPR